MIWLYLSSFGIMFAVLSWMQESGIFSTDIGALKGQLNMKAAYSWSPVKRARN